MPSISWRSQEFPEVSIDKAEQTLSVLTEPIDLQGTHLGPFRIVLRWNRLRQRRSYDVEASEPNPAQGEEEITHPHVQGRQLCEGEGAICIKAALSQGRIFDFFLLVKQILETYNPSSAYISLDRWNGVACPRAAGTCLPMSKASASAAMRHSAMIARPAVRAATAMSAAAAVMNVTPAVVTSAGVVLAHPLIPISCCANPVSKTNLRINPMKPMSPRQSIRLPSRWKPKRAPPLRLTPCAWAKLLYLLHRGSTEVAGFGVSSRSDLLLIQDVQLVPQLCTEVTVELDDAAVADYFDTQVDRGRVPEEFGRIWVHTHPGSSPLPSSTDENTFRRCFSSADWAVMFIVARGGQTYARMRFGAGPGGQILLPVEVDFSQPFTATDHATWQAEYDSAVKVDEEWTTRRPSVPRREPLQEAYRAANLADWNEGSMWDTFLGPAEPCDGYYF